MTDDIEITADGLNIHASEKVSTGEYETGNVSATVEATVEGADLTDGVPEGLKQRVYGLQRSLQGVVKAAAEERQREAIDNGKL